MQEVLTGAENSDWPTLRRIGDYYDGLVHFFHKSGGYKLTSEVVPLESYLKLRAGLLMKANFACHERVLR